MAFHGALMGVLIALAILAWRERCSFWVLSDFVCLMAPVGIFFGALQISLMENWSGV